MRRQRRRQRTRRRIGIVLAVCVVAVVLAGVAVAVSRGIPPVPPVAESSPTPRPSPSVSPTPTVTPIPIPTPTAPASLPMPRDAEGRARLLITGDSLAAGFFAREERDGFAALVASALEPAEVTTASRAHQTLTTVSGITEVPTDLSLAVVELGTNDVGLQTPLADFEAQYADLLARIRAASPRAALVCLGTWTDDGDAYDDIVSRACIAGGGRYVGLAGLFDTADLHGPAGRDTFVGESDRFHPNDAGHRAIADAVLAEIAR